MAGFSASASGSAEIGRDDDILGKSREDQEAGFKSAATSEGVGDALYSLAKDSIDQIREGRFSAVEFGEGFNEAAKYVPIAGQAVELLDEVFKAADSLGIGKELRLIYHSAATGQKVGVALGGAASNVAIASGQVGIGAAVAPVLAVAAAPIGIAAAIGFGVLSIFSDNAEAKKKRTEQVQAFVTGLDEVAKRKTIDALIVDQDAMLSNVEKLLASFPFDDRFRPVAEKSRSAARDLGAFYRIAKGTMSAEEIAALESVANVARWKAALDVAKADKEILTYAIGTKAWQEISQNIAKETESGVYRNVIQPIMAIPVKRRIVSRGFIGWVRRNPGIAVAGGFAAAVGLASLIAVVTTEKEPTP